MQVGTNTAVESLEPRRLLAGVSLDSTFGSGGKVLTNFGSSYDEPVDIAHQPDGKILVLGESGTYINYTLARYLPNGTLDTTFGSGGKVVLSQTGHPQGL